MVKGGRRYSGLRGFFVGIETRNQKEEEGTLKSPRPNCDARPRFTFFLPLSRFPLLKEKKREAQKSSILLFPVDEKKKKKSVGSVPIKWLTAGILSM